MKAASIEVKCPTCKAGPEQACQSASGRPLRGGQLHATRVPPPPAPPTVGEIVLVVCGQGTQIALVVRLDGGTLIVRKWSDHGARWQAERRIPVSRYRGRPKSDDARLERAVKADQEAAPRGARSRKEDTGCKRCGMAADALIHTGGHPTRCHTFEARERRVDVDRIAKRKRSRATAAEGT